MPTLGRLKTRPEFLRVAAARRKAVRPGVIVQARRRRPEEDKAATDHEAPVHFGLTASRKVGGAVLRNRARRRLRAAANAILPERGQAGMDYVLIARGATVTRSFPDLLGDLESALAEVHGRRSRDATPSRGRTSKGQERRGDRGEAEETERPAEPAAATPSAQQERKGQS